VRRHPSMTGLTVEKYLDVPLVLGRFPVLWGYPPGGYLRVNYFDSVVYGGWWLVKSSI
jgi:hypothetical protein